MRLGRHAADGYIGGILAEVSMAGRFDSVTRRDALIRVGQFGAGALSLPTLLAEQAATAATGGNAQSKSAKSCILIYLWGGPPQQDTFDLKPDAPEGIRSEFSPIATNAPGLTFCDQLPQMARVADKMAVIRSLTHHSNDHVHSVYYTLTGRIDPTLQGALRQRRRSDFPTLGSVVSKFSPPGGLPNTVTVPSPVGHDGVVYAGTHAGFLGPQHDPLELKSPGGVDGPPPHSLEMPDELSPARVRGRFSLLSQIEASQRDLDERVRGGAGSLSSFRDQALRMLTSSDAKGAFNLDRESTAMRDRYGRNEYGESILLARRLVEAGVRLVTVVWSYICPNGKVANVWDNHGGIDSLGGISGYAMLKEKYCLPPLDQAYSALLTDLHDRGLLDETMVAMYGEFGRTPRINKNGGRDHWGACQSAVLAGGGIRGGQMHGTSDAQAAAPKSDPVSPPDLLATIYHGLGIDSESEVRDQTGRPYKISEGKPLTGLFG